MKGKGMPEGPKWQQRLATFRLLSWQLTFSYTLVTVATLAVLEVVVFVGAWLLIVSTELLPRQVSAILSLYAAPSVRPILEQTPPDLGKLRAILEDFYTHGVKVQGSEEPLVLTAIAGGTGSELVVVDAEGNFLSSIPAGLGVEGQLFIPKGMSRAPDVLTRALTGETESDRLFEKATNNNYLIAAPIEDENGKILGALYLVTRLSFQSASDDYFRSSMIFIGESLIVVILAAGLLGTVFGFITARGLTKRLRNLAQAAESWGRGDFSVTIQDQSQDEIAQLGLQLNLMAEQVRTLLQTREQLAALEERNRLARDLHDSVKQEVFAATMTLGAAEALWERDRAAAREKVSEARQLSQQAQKELTALIRELRPAALEGKGLAMAVREYAREWSQQTGVPITVWINGERPLSLVLEQALFRVMQEALSNTSRHSGAHAIEVQLNCAGPGVVLSVKDDGRGFDVVSAQGKGLGLRSMRERVEALGGTLQIESRQGTGTTVRAALP